MDSLDLKHPECKLDGATPFTKDTKHIFLELDELQPEIEIFVRRPVINGDGRTTAKKPRQPG